jgi:hypothetical protein
LDDDAKDGRARAGGSTIKTRAGWVPKIPPSRSRDAAVAPETSLFLFPDDTDYLREEAPCQYKTENENRFHVSFFDAVKEKPVAPSGWATGLAHEKASTKSCEFRGRCFGGISNPTTACRKKNPASSAIISLVCPALSLSL